MTYSIKFVVPYSRKYKRNDSSALGSNSNVTSSKKLSLYEMRLGQG